MKSEQVKQQLYRYKEGFTLGHRDMWLVDDLENYSISGSAFGLLNVLIRKCSYNDYFVTYPLSILDLGNKSHQSRSSVYRSLKELEEKEIVSVEAEQRNSKTYRLWPEVEHIQARTKKEREVKMANKQDTVMSDWDGDKDVQQAKEGEKFEGYALNKDGSTALDLEH